MEKAMKLIRFRLSLPECNLNPISHKAKREDKPTSLMDVIDSSEEGKDYVILKVRSLEEAEACANIWKHMLESF